MIWWPLWLTFIILSPFLQTFTFTILRIARTPPLFYLLERARPYILDLFTLVIVFLPQYRGYLPAFRLSNSRLWHFNMFGDFVLPKVHIWIFGISLWCIMFISTYSYGLGLSKWGKTSIFVTIENIDASYWEDSYLYDIQLLQDSFFDISVICLYSDCCGRHCCLFYSIWVSTAIHKSIYEGENILLACIRQNGSIGNLRTTEPVAWHRKL